MGKKICVSYFFMKNPYMKFQNPSMHGSEVMLCIKKRNGRTHGQTDTRTNVPEAICPSNFFEVGGIIMFCGKLSSGVHEHFFFLFGSYGPFKNISLILCRSFIKGGQKQACDPSESMSRMCRYISYISL